MKNRTFLPGDDAHCLKTVALRSVRAIAHRGEKYTIIAAKQGCCGQMIDIGYHHHAEITIICSLCGTRTQQQAPIYIPSRFFVVATIPQDALSLMMERLERGFAYLDIVRR